MAAPRGATGDGGSPASLPFLPLEGWGHRTEGWGHRTEGGGHRTEGGVHRTEGWGQRTEGHDCRTCLHLARGPTSPVLQAVAFLTSAPPAGKVGPGALFPPVGFKPPSALPPNLIVTGQSGIWDETHSIRGYKLKLKHTTGFYPPRPQTVSFKLYIKQ